MTNVNVIQLLLTTGAAARVTRLVTRDTITAPLRHRLLYNRDQRAALAAGEMVPPPSNPLAARARAKLYELATCDWCAGLWIATAIAALSAIATRRDQHKPAGWFTVPAGALTASHAVGWLASHEHD